MQNYRTLAGWLLIIAGIVYLAKPNVFRRGMWVKTSIAQRHLSPEGYVRYMRVVGLSCVVVGIVLLVWTCSKP